VRNGHRGAPQPTRCQGDAGTALVEMAFLIAPLCLLLFGIIVYGYLMSFRQNMTSAAAEGARAGALAPSSDGDATAIDRATKATSDALKSFGEDCDNGRTTCTVVVDTCPASVSTTDRCVTVTVQYDYEHHPLMPDVPIVSAAIPGTFTSSSTAQVNS
jgi:Flp pilus assembly protein TadG